MTIIRNNIIPFPGFKAVNILGILFARRSASIDEATLRHEAIHTAQMRELLWLPFYIIYLAEWLCRLLGKGDAYRSVSFEREAYANQDNPDYLHSRRRFAMWRNIKHQ